MKRLAVVVVLAALAVLSAPAATLAATSTWSIDPAHTQAVFTVRHMAISNVKGQFQKTTGTVVLDEGDVTRSTVEASIDVSSIDTRVEQRDGHLKSPDFFDVAKYPAITFKSTKVEKAGEGKLKVTGNLTIKGVTRPVVLDVEGPSAPVKDPQGSLRRGLTATTTINRFDYGLEWNKLVEAGPVVGKEIKIEIEAELVKQAPAKTN
jgi:polyisoprenoid-binding protein YceI